MAKKRRPPRVHPLVSSKFARVLASSAVVLSSTSKPFSSAGALVSSLTSDIVDSAVPVETKRTLPSTPGVAPESAVVRSEPTPLQSTVLVETEGTLLLSHEVTVDFSSGVIRCLRIPPRWSPLLFQVAPVRTRLS
ncbi:hypothetical protein ISN45_Aa04g011230 [Arabidopsis thaliana x Arabidopsis arenosa]|uniref:Uncharacterized protein n=1 Tax=Arabidopsis thaliana x Arabidopsis arenosa TaxID=1240361 RepID=A0A8T2A413_9BRAS|nr:hypothetical protein ISN45_Aa04g011230 [Arabidopsis thaliana x Arabidopsis arenosa]